jgi:hypothetical protein
LIPYSVKNKLPPWAAGKRSPDWKTSPSDSEMPRVNETGVRMSGEVPSLQIIQQDMDIEHRDSEGLD